MVESSKFEKIIQEFKEAYIQILKFQEPIYGLPFNDKTLFLQAFQNWGPKTLSQLHKYKYYFAAFFLITLISYPLQISG